jgi:ligand-binding sensor domain-containing protein
MKFHQLDVNDGLSNSHVICIFQDSKGFLWVGTNDGLNRYDGYSFKIYRQEQGDTTGFFNNTINAICEDKNGTLWVSTFNRGFYRYDPKNDKFVVIPELSSRGEIFKIQSDKNGELWITGVMNGHAFVANLNRDTRQWEQHLLFRSSETVVGMHPISKDEYWIVVRDQGLFRWNRRTNNVTRHSDLVQPSFIHRTTEDQEGNIWLASRTGLYKLDTVRMSLWTVNTCGLQQKMEVLIEWIGRPADLPTSCTQKMTPGHSAITRCGPCIRTGKAVSGAERFLKVCACSINKKKNSLNWM